VVAWAAISREITVAPSGEFEFSQIYLYDEAITDLDAFIEALADEKANGAELVDVELTALRTGALSSEPVMVLTFRHDLAGQRVEEAAAMHTHPSFPVPTQPSARTLPRPQSSLFSPTLSEQARLGPVQALAEAARPG
jgi:hypothetical protein